MLIRPASIVEAITSPAFFGPAFKPVDSWAAWLALWKAVYALPLAEEEDALFAQCTGRTKPLACGYREIYTVAGRRSGKTRMAATLAAYEALWGDWADHLASGERAYLFLFAVDRTQAQVAFNYVKGLLELFPDEIEKITSDEIQLRNRTSIMIKTSNYASSRGFSTAGVFLDELAFYPTDQYASPASELITALMPSLLPGGFIFGASTPYGRMGFLWDVFEEYWGQSESDVLIWRAGTRTLNPTFSESIFSRLFKRNRAHMATEMEAEFRSDVESFMPESLLIPVMTLSPALPLPGRAYFAFIDPSGGRVDSMTLAIAHAEEGMIQVDRLEEFIAPFSPDDAVSRFSEVMKSYGIKRATSDRFGGEWVAENFRLRGIVVDPSPLTASDLYQEFAVLVQGVKCRLIGNDKLHLQLRSLVRSTRSGGRDLVSHPVGGHDDLANAVAGACVMVKRHYVKWSPREQAARMPVTTGHQIPHDTAIHRERAAYELRRSMEAEMDEFMRSGDVKCNRIIR